MQTTVAQGTWKSFAFVAHIQQYLECQIQLCFKRSTFTDAERQWEDNYEQARCSR